MGKVRKYYKITKKGYSVLDKSKIKIKELVNEIFEE
jgi:DNA-binding PadR family transcriptional regulator